MNNVPLASLLAVWNTPSYALPSSICHRQKYLVLATRHSSGQQEFTSSMNTDTNIFLACLLACACACVCVAEEGMQSCTHTRARASPQRTGPTHLHLHLMSNQQGAYVHPVLVLRAGLKGHVSPEVAASCVVLLCSPQFSPAILHHLIRHGCKSYAVLKIMVIPAPYG
jgi:hypothetical protein